MVAEAKRLLEVNKDRPTRITTGDRRPGYRLWVYGRRGPCLRCGTPIARADQGPLGQMSKRVRRCPAPEMSLRHTPIAPGQTGHR